MISVAVGMLQKPERIRLAVRQLGATSSGGISLIWIREKCLGEAFTPEVKGSWLASYAFLASDAGWCTRQCGALQQCTEPIKIP